MLNQSSHSFCKARFLRGSIEDVGAMFDLTREFHQTKHAVGTFEWSNCTWSWDAFSAVLMNEDFNGDSLNRVTFENWCCRKESLTVKAVWSISWKIDKNIDIIVRVWYFFFPSCFLKTLRSILARGFEKWSQVLRGILPSCTASIDFQHVLTSNNCSDWSHICSDESTHATADVSILNITPVYI